MATPYIWGNLGRAVNDPTLIDEAIALAVAAHGDDPDAHLGPYASLNSHRAAKIIDHRAESVVNDKLAARARRYTAIVDPLSESDFDTIEAAHTYVLTKGGGSIFIVPGTYYLSTILELNGTVNFYGADADTTIITTDFDTGKYFRTGYWSAGWTGNYVFEDLQFNALSSNVFMANGVLPLANDTVYFRSCIFRGAGAYFNYAGIESVFIDCVFYLTTIGAIQPASYATLRDCKVATTSTSGNLRLFDVNLYGEVGNVIIDNLSSRLIDELTFTGSIEYFGGSFMYGVRISNSTLGYFKSSAEYYDTCVFSKNVINLKSGQILALDGGGTILEGNDINGSVTPSVVLASTSSLFILDNNYLNGVPTDNGTNNIIGINTPEVPYASLASAAVAMDLRNNAVAQLIPNTTRTLTTTIAPKGARRAIVILTSGVTSYTLTFGAGFKTTGTLATGTVTARRFVIEFLSDGTSMVETSRTVAIA